MRKLGIDIIQEAPWGTHLCQFYQTKEDLIDILVPYFKTGLEANEFCMWITSEPLKREDARNSLMKAVKNLDDYLKKGQIEILDYSQWYLDSSGKFESDRVLRAWIEKENQALRKGFDGLRLTGNTFWLEAKDWKSFTDYEAIIDSNIGLYKMIALCTYSLKECGASEILDVMSNHQYALIRRGDTWKLIQNVDRRRTEKEIRNLARFPSENPNPVLRVSKDGEVLYANEASLPVLADWSIKVGGGVPADWCRLIKESFYSGQGKVVKASRIGDQIFLFDIVPVADCGYLNLYSKDITEQKRAEEELEKHRFHLEKLVKKRTSELETANEKLQAESAKLESILQQMPSGVIIAEVPTGRLILGNEQVARIFRHPFLPSANIEEYREWKGFHPEDGRPYLPQEWPLARSVLYGEVVTDEEVDILRGDGSFGTISINSAPIYKGGKIIACAAIFNDITERKQIEEMRSRLAAIVDSSEDAIIGMTLEGIITSWNHGAEKIFGYSDREARGRSISFTFPSERLHEFTEILEKLRQGQGIGHYETVHVRKDGKRIIINLSLSPIKDRTGKIIGVSSIERDITESKRMEEELQKMQKLESIGVLAGGIAHDFRNLLTAIVGGLSLLKLHLDPKGNNLTLFNQAEKASQQATDLAQQLLTFAKGGAPVKKFTSISRIVKEIGDFTVKGSKTRCTFFLPEDLWPVEADEGQISQAVTNLIINGRQAMPCGGMISICAENVTLGVESGLPVKCGKYIKISVKDQGTGISKENLPRIFDPYFTTKETGSGLGLATTYSIIKRHGGYITVESQEGAGTTFHIYLPASKQEIFQVKHVEEETSLSGEGRILVMDDQESVRDAIGQMLMYLGYQVVLTAGGSEAVELYTKGKEAGLPFDVVILDLTVPGGMGGIEAVKMLHEVDHEVKAIVSSGYANDPIMAEYQQYGFCGVIVKPYNVRDLGKMLKKVFMKKGNIYKTKFKEGARSTQ
ncbi:MAG: MEDS domain-containing protein [bacterium]